MVDSLRRLLTAIRDGASVLPWVVEHAPDGDADAALARAWARCEHVEVLAFLREDIDWVRGRDARPLNGAWEASCAAQAACPLRAGGWLVATCPPCASAIRAVAPAPTLADILEVARG